MVTHYLNNKTKKFTGFDRFASFVLIGNNIDGHVNVEVVEFTNYQQAINDLPGIFNLLEFDGEWDLAFYQVPKNYSIIKLYGYFKVPSKGKKVFEYGYNNAGTEISIFLSPALIHITTIEKNICDKWDDDEEHLDFDIMESYLTTLLKEDLNRKSFRDADYPGEIDRLHEEAWKVK